MKSQIIVVVSDLAQSLAIRETCRTLNLPYEETPLIERASKVEEVIIGEGSVKPADRDLFALAKKLLDKGPMKRADLVGELTARRRIDAKKAGYRVHAWLKAGAIKPYERPA